MSGLAAEGGEGGFHWTRDHVQALLRVSKAAALNHQLDDVLEVIAQEACRVTQASAASVLVSEPGGRFRLAASVGYSPNYETFLQSDFIAWGRSVTRIAADELHPIVIDDIGSDPIVERLEVDEGRRLAEREGMMALVVLPLLSGSRVFGVFHLSRKRTGPWYRAELELASTFAQHAAAAIDNARLTEAHRRQVEGLERLVEILRDQTHEYANRLHVLSGLHALGEGEEAERFLDQLMTNHHDNHASVIERVHPPILAGLLVAQMSVSSQLGVEVVLDPETSIRSLPDSLGGAEAVTIIANLIDNAVDAVSDMPPERKRASVKIVEGRDVVTITVRDWGSGMPEGRREKLFERGGSSKHGHAGIGLALVSDAVASVRGSIAVETRPEGTEITVTLPRE